MKRKKTASFVRLDALSDGLLRRMTRGDTALLWLRARWGSIVGEPLVRKVEPVALSGRRLTLSLLDPAWRKPVEATLEELERKLARELPELKPRITLK
ncbi:MAG: DUF721 domain-containing protein [Acidobacteriota bacterium]|nr:DUF721 domain-containing protein [Acidobacteriota bacterium]